MKRFAVLILVMILLLSFGGCFGQNPEETPLLIHSNGQDHEPYCTFTWASSYTAEGWLSASGYRISMLPPDVFNEFPEICYSSDFTLQYGKNASLSSVTVYDADRKIIYDHTTEEVWKDLEPGTYYLVFQITVRGRYIAAEEQHESTGYECAFKLVILKAP